MTVDPTAALMVPLQTTWATEALGGSMLVAIPVAALAGLLSFFSPCVVPLLPGYLSFATGMSAAEVAEGGNRRRMLAGTSLFVLGFAAVFMLTGALMGTLGTLMLEHQRGLSIGIGVVTMLLGGIFMGLVPLGQRDIRLHRVPRLGLVAAPLLGIVFGLGWTPCMGPTLGVVMGLALNEGSSQRGALLAFCYALGLGVPFIIAGLAMGRLATAIGFVRRHQQAVQRVGGALMVLVGLLLVTGAWDQLMAVIRQWTLAYGAPI
ncbi:cytochrome c biogenesis protein CcdA [Luteococcus sediminum]